MVNTIYNKSSSVGTTDLSEIKTVIDDYQRSDKVLYNYTSEYKWLRSATSIQIDNGVLEVPDSNHRIGGFGSNIESVAYDIDDNYLNINYSNNYQFLPLVHYNIIVNVGLVDYKVVLDTTNVSFCSLALYKRETDGTLSQVSWTTYPHAMTLHVLVEGELNVSKV